MEKDRSDKQPTFYGDVSLKKTLTDIPVPEKIGPYEIERVLARGGMSILYLGVCPENDKPTAIKALSSRFLSNLEIIQRFLNEAEIIATTNHPNIVKLYGHGKWQGGLYIAMEFIRGISLRQLLLETPISLREALRIVLDIAYALCHLHTHGVIHRDLKPENILITDVGQIKVIDFGIAQLLTEEPVKEGEANQRLIGTPIYMSPEQREHPETVSYPSDIYSLGIIAYELVLGKLSYGHIHLPLMPKGLQKILAKALQSNPSNRYQDVVDFITDISEYLNSSSFRHEKRIEDDLADLLLDLQSSQGLCSPKNPPNWEGVSIGFAIHKGVNSYGSFYDFFTFPDHLGYGIVVANSKAKGGKSIIYTSLFEGIFQSLRNQTLHPAELSRELNSLLRERKIDQSFAFNYLVLVPKDNLLRHISCGNGELFKVDLEAKSAIKISQENPVIGESGKAVFRETVLNWNQGDSLILSSCGERKGASLAEFVGSESFFSEIIKKREGVSPQEFVDAALNKTAITLFHSFREHPVSFIQIIRNVCD